jgi:high-affinity Fe2+/Pb2+ permease
MAEILTSDNSVPSEVMESQVSDEAESLRIGEEMIEAHEQKLAGKYKNTEELEAAYLELQKKLGGQEDNVQEESEETTEVDWLAEAQRAMQESGELSEELTKQLSDMNGMDVFNAMKDNNAVESRDLSDSEMNAVYQAVGGQDQYSNLIDWAQQNFSEAEINAYDSVIETGNIAQINLALQALYYRYTDAVGSEGKLLQGKPASTEATFRSQAELIQAMNDSRYESDPAYRQDVLEKLDRSDLNF